MDEAQYNVRVAKAFKTLLAALDQADPDQLDAESTGEMITITGANKEKCVVNTQRAVSQIWVAGKSQGIHFSFDEASQRWRDDKGKGLELFAFVADCVSAIAGIQLRLP